MDSNTPRPQLPPAELAVSLADALESIAKMPVVDPELNLTRGDVINAYHEALRIARDAVWFYERQTQHD